MDQNPQNQQISTQTDQNPAQNYNPPNKLSKKQQADWVERVKGDYKSSATYIATYYKTMWSDMRKLYNSERVLIGYNGISDTFVPLSYSIIESLVASAGSGKPQIQFIPTRPDQATNTEVLNDLLSFYWDLDGWTPKTEAHTRSLFKEGSSVMYAYWNIDHPCLSNVPNDDWFCDPTATFFNYHDQAAYMGHRFLARRSVLENEKMVDPQSGDLAPKYMNLSKLTGRNDEDETSKEKEDIHNGSTLDKEAQADEVEVIVYYSLDTYIMVGNRQEVIYYDTNPFKARQQFLGYKNPTGMYPYIFDAFAPNPNQLYGRSVLQSIMKPQELLNDLTNQNIDAVTWSLDPEMELDPMYSDYLDKIESAAGNVYPFKPGSYQPVQKLPIPSSVFQERSNIKNEIREATGIDQMMMGALSQRVTAAEVNFLSAQASKRFDLYISALENGGYYTLAKLVFQLIQHYVTQPVMYRVVGKDGVEWQKYDPAEFKGDYEPRIKLKATLDSEKDMKTRDIKELYSAMIGNPYINEQELTRFVLQKGFNLEYNESTELVKTPEQAQQDSQSQGQSTGKPPTELINYKDAPPDIQAQMESAAGFAPSATHETSMSSHLLSNMDAQHSALNSMQQAIAPESSMPQMMAGNKKPQPQAAGHPHG